MNGNPAPRCLDCAHYRFFQHYGLSFQNMARCHRNTFSIPTALVRGESGACGPSGILFHPRPSESLPLNAKDGGQ